MSTEAAPAEAPAPAAPVAPKAKKNEVKQVKEAGLKKPVGERKKMELSKLCLDRRLQFRTSLTDDVTVTRYTEVAKDDPDAFPELEVIELTKEEAEKLELESPFVVWDGFQRGDAFKKAKVKSVKVHVAKGSYCTARMLALQANHDAALPRTSADLRRAFYQLLDDEAMMSKVKSWTKAAGGMTRALAIGAGISKSLVQKVLDSMGKKISGQNIIDATEKKGSAKLEGGPHDRGRDPVGGLRTESKEALAKRETAVIIKEMQYEAAALQRRVEALLSREDIATVFKEVCKKNGNPVVREKHKSKDPKARTKEVTTEYLPIVDKMLAIMDEVADQHKELTVKQK